MDTEVYDRNGEWLYDYELSAGNCDVKVLFF